MCGLCKGNSDVMVHLKMHLKLAHNIQLTTLHEMYEYYSNVATTCTSIKSSVCFFTLLILIK